MKIRFILFAATVASAAWGQATIEDWAAGALLQSDQSGSILTTLNQPLAGHPFSAAAVVHNVHTLEDGTRIDRTTTSLLYRDAQGRRRTETDGVIDISDPVAHAGIHLNAAQMTAIRRSGDFTVVEPKWTSTGGASSGASRKGPATASKSGKARPAQDSVTEDLGVQLVNGILAHGTRTSLTIPKGAIGNDRDFKVTKETWISDDLHILVKSIDSDPRFGTSAFNLTNIVQAEPAAALFDTRPPAGYAVRLEPGFRVR